LYETKAPGPQVSFLPKNLHPRCSDSEPALLFKVWMPQGQQTAKPETLALADREPELLVWCRSSSPSPAVAAEASWLLEEAGKG
jgi:hypothetical protein